jgi:hypothetical protein
MRDRCELRAANGSYGVTCDGPDCMFWRLADHLELSEGLDRDGCAIQHFELLEGGQEVARWLLSVKRRMEERTPGPFAAEHAHGPLSADA